MRLVALLAVAALLAGCLAEKPLPQGQDVERRTLAQGQHSGIEEPLRSVVASEAEWAALWDRHASVQSPPPERPAVDFATERVLAVGLGQKGSACWSIGVDAVVRSGSEVVAVVTTTDQRGGVCAAVLAHPFHFVAIRDTGAAVRFDERARSVDPGTIPQPTPGLAEPLSVRPLSRGSFSGVHEDTRALLRNEFSWKALWAKHRPDEAPPRVFFPNESVVAVVERGPTGCFGVRVGNVTYDSAARVLVVEVVHVTTPSHVACVTAIQDAYDFVAIPDREGDVRFVDRNETGGGEGAGEGGSLAPRVLAKGAQSGVEGGLRQLVRDEAAWRDVWSRHASYAQPPPEAPKVDFASESVIAVVLPDKPNSCWAVELGNVTRDGAAIRVEVVTRAPPAGAVCGSAITRPFVFAAVPARDGEAVFTDAR